MTFRNQTLSIRRTGRLVRVMAIALWAITLSACSDDDNVSVDAGENDADVCIDTCAGEGSATCDATGTGRMVCTQHTDGCLYSVHESCETGDRCAGSACVPCTGQVGTFREQVLNAGGEDRAYYLHVPDGYECADPWPVLFDLHGSAGAPRPEEAYGLADARATADGSGFILVRPRSRSSMEGGFEVFRWDQNPGDPERNRQFLNDLAADLSDRYHLDPDRLYVMGFSSGTNQTTEALADDTGPFNGFGFVGGGTWTVNAITDTGARLYLVTGFRDYMRMYHDALMTLVQAAAIPAEQIFIRETDAGHELYGWMYPEMWAFLDAGLRPHPGTPGSGWTRETTPAQGSLMALTKLPGNELMAFGENAVMVRRAAAGSWSEVVPAGTPAFAGRAFAAACITGDGSGMAVGGGLVALSHDSGNTWTHAPAIPEMGGPMLGFSFMNGVGCASHRIIAAGYWAGARSDNGGQTYADIDFDNGGYRAQVAAVAASTSTTWMAVGYFHYVARSTDNGMTWTLATFSPSTDWAYDITEVEPGIWVMVGEQGHIWRSTDDGATFTSVLAPPGPDLYAVSFHDNLTGLAVGRDGSAYLTEDGGANWTAAHTGLDHFLGDVRWLDDGTAIAVGEAGTALHFTP